MNLDIRYSCSPRDFQRYNTEETRAEFLIENLFTPGEVIAVYSHVDRMVALGIMPAGEPLPIDRGIDVWKNFGTDYFLERRECGLFNVGGAGRVNVDGEVYPLDYKDCLYITRGARQVTFESDDPAKPAKFYVVSAPAHTRYENKLIRIADAAKKPCGSAETSNQRVINQFIHPDVLKTCQLSMGMTVLAPGSVWNTMRRSWVWAGIVFQTLPGSSTVMPIDSWQVFSTSGWMNWLITRLLLVSGAPQGFLAASAMRIRRVS